MEEVVNSDYIKKSKIHYLKCDEGELHQGEVLNFVCVDSKCSKKGLICPVCRMSDHQDHKVIPLKLFLGEMKNRFSSQTSESELNSLSDYLRTLDNTKKELLSIVKETVSQIADKVRRLETTIVDNYNHLRKMVLTQSTVATKLPNLISLMLGQGEKDPKELHRQFQKYADLIRYEGDKPSFFDSSKKIVEDYSNLPGTVTAHLSTLVPELTKVFDSLPLSIENSKQSKAPSLSFTFSDTNKRQDITLSNPKSVAIDPQLLEQGGYIFVNEGLGVQHQSIAFKIIGNTSGYLSVGMGLTDIVKNKQYLLDAGDTNHGAYVISSMGANFHHKEPEKQEAQSFVYSAGDVVVVEWNKKDKKLQFSRRNGVEKFVMDINLPDIQLAKLQFMVGIFEEGDQIEIVD